MDFPKWGVPVLSLTIALTIAAGCAGGPKTTPLVAAPVSPIAFTGSTPKVHPNGSKSWMLPEAQNQLSLLYVSNSGTASVTVYTYLNGGGLLLVGTLTGFSRPTGMCTDKTGDVWIPDYGTNTLYEYKHGGTTPIETIRQVGSSRPVDCSIDPDTGNLAVVNQFPNAHYYPAGNVKIYPKGSRNGTKYRAPYGTEPDFLAYDDKGNLYVDGTLNPYGYGDSLFELPNGGKQFTNLTLEGGTLNIPGAIQWVKPTLLVGDQNFQNQRTNGAYKLFVSGSTATVVGTLQFKGTQQAYGFWRRAGRVIVPDHTGNIVRIYNLSDGSLFSKLTTGISSPFGAVVSQ